LLVGIALGPITAKSSLFRIIPELLEKFLLDMKFNTFLIVIVLSVTSSVSAAEKGAQPNAQKIDDLRRSFFMPVAANSLCPKEDQVSAEKFAAFRSGALVYLDYLQATAEPTEKQQFEKARMEITGTDIPDPFLARATKIYHKYSPAEAHSLFREKLNRMFEGDIIEMLMRREQKRRSEAKSD
jgi:hypothetical protein